jgi:hypothetical protein
VSNREPGGESDQQSARRSRELDASNLRVVRVGHGGNCSSVGSVVDTLFVSAAVGGAMLAAICAAMKAEPITVVGPAGDRTRAGDPEAADATRVDAELEAPAEATNNPDTTHRPAPEPAPRTPPKGRP